MAGVDTPHEMTIGELFSFFRRILGPERDFYMLAAVYGIGISLLSLATPISVQMLINTVANTGLTTPLVVLSATLFGLLLFSGLLNALRIHLMEIFGRRFYARMVSEIALRSIYAQNPFFIDQGRAPLFNRYFDIIIVQKTIPVLLIGGFTLILQAGVGFILVSLYHPLFLGFNLVVALLIWAIWLVWGRGAVRSGINLSHKKHDAAAWLENLGASNGFFKSERHVANALTNTDQATAGYVNQHRAHFRQHFSQTISFLILYAAASAILLGLGGWLVIQGELTLGQLVAAELVLSVAYFGVSQLGAYLVYFYDLCAAIEELSHFYGVTQEEPDGEHAVRPASAELSFVSAKGVARSRPAVFDFALPSGANIMGGASSYGLQRLMTNFVKRHEQPDGGYIAFGGADIKDADPASLRQEILVLNRPTIIETTIREYLNLSAKTPDPAETLRVLKIVGLEPLIIELEDGLDTKLAASGWPLSVAEIMQLKLAAALLAHPRVLILNQMFDLIAEECLVWTIRALREETETTVIYFSNRRRDLGFDLFLYLDHEEQLITGDFDEFYEWAYGAKDEHEPPRLISGDDQPYRLLEKK
ncbi:MAG: ABC transporter ATP-binding protein [Pseudomonadota bacterium]